jgi:hypothetical protein
MPAKRICAKQQFLNWKTTGIRPPLTMTWLNQGAGIAAGTCRAFLPEIIFFVNQSHGRSIRLLDGFIVEPVCTRRSTIDSDFYNISSHC